MNHRDIRTFRRDLRSFSRILSRQVEVCCCCDVTPAQCHALLALEEAGPVPNGELATRLQVDASTLSRTVEQLVEKDLVVRKPHPDDRRATLLEVSDRGGKVAANIHEAADALYSGILEEIPAEARAEALRKFSMLVESFRHWQSRRSRTGC